VSDLAETWKSLTPRQRDALAAEARGDQPEVSWEIVTPEGGATAFSTASALVSREWLADRQRRGLMLGYKVEPWKHYPRYSERWSDAGLLIEEMLAAGVEVRFMREMGRPKVVSWPCDASPIIATSIDNAGWPELLALAYVLWKEGRR
jgi:hypothetical protein